MRTLALCAALLAPLAAGAQVTLTSDLSSGTSPQIYIGRAACKTTVINFRWGVGSGHPLTGESVHAMRAHTSSSCSSTTASGVDVLDQPQPAQAQSGVDPRTAADLILDTSDAGLPGGCDNIDRRSASPYTTHYCIQLQSGSSASFAEIPVNFATANPTPPVNLEIEPGDQHLNVNWTAGDTAESIATYDVHVFAADAGLVPSKYSTRVNAPQTKADVVKTDDGVDLINDQPYTVQVVANDTYGNVSDPSPADAGGTPTHILDFYGLYRDNGGAAAGGHGCSSAGAATWIALLALGAALLARRRRKARNGVLLALVLALLAPGARAEWRAPERPPRRFLVGFKIDRYDPKVDSEAAFAGLAAESRPYYLIFRGRAPLRSQLEVDWEVAHPFGSILLGATVGYWQNIGKGLTAKDLKPSGDTALLDVIPLGVIATYRFDWLADRWARFPLIPYAQIGLQRALWASFSGTGAVSKDPTHGGRGSGWTWGYTSAVGFALNLDAIDPDLAREAYVDTGIQRTALFAEYGWTRLDGFRSGNALILTDRAWRFGLSVEF